MNRIDTIIEQLMDTAANPKAAMEQFEKETGKGCVGIMPVYAPEELVHAAGYLPVGIWGGQKSISKARAYLPPFACSIMQSVMEMQLEGVFDNLKAVLFSVPCDTLKCLSQKWKGKSPVIVFTHPQNRVIEAANKFLAHEYTLVREKLEKILDTKITDEALNKSIDIYNENRRAMRQFTELAAEYPQIFTPAKRHAVIKSRFYMEKSVHTALVTELIAEVKKTPATPWAGKKIVTTGILAEPNEVLDIFSEYGFAVVADDLAQESRQFRVDVPEGNDPIYRMAQWWQDFYGCALATDVKKARGQMLVDLVKKQNADAVVVCMMKFCDPEEFDYPIYYQELEKAGIPSLMIEIDQESTAFEQVKTRIQSFSEML